MVNEPVLTTDEIATRLRVNPETVRRWCRSGKLRTLRAGAAYRVTEAALNEFLAVPPPEKMKAVGATQQRQRPKK